MPEKESAQQYLKHLQLDQEELDSPTAFAIHRQKLQT
jgi:hypothetical protein